VDAVMALYDRIVDEDLLVRRMTIAACHLLPETDVVPSGVGQQLDLFSQEDPEEKEEDRLREKRRQQAVIEIKKKFGKNAILKGMNFEEGATAKDRNAQIGGHKA
jgi:DNA polymerase V